MIEDTTVGNGLNNNQKTCQKHKVKKLSSSRVKWPRDKDYKWQSNLSKVGVTLKVTMVQLNNYYGLAL